MNRIFLASEDRDESEWFSDELKDFGRVVRTIDSLDFFIPQWESVDANIVIFMESIVHSEESFLKLLQNIRIEKPSVTIMFVFHRDEDDFVEELIKNGIICLSYLDLEPGVVETRLIGIGPPTSLLYVENESMKDANDSMDYSSQEDGKSELTKTESTEMSLEYDRLVDHVGDNTEKEKVNSKSSGSMKDIKRQLSETGEKLFNIIENKKNIIQERKNEITLLESVKPDDLNFAPVTKPIDKKPRRDRLLGTAVIAVTGAEPGVGTTHTSISIANFLARQNYSVILVEANDSNDYVEIEAAYEGISDIKLIKTTSFNLLGVKYIKNATELNMIDLLATNYSFIVLDLGFYDNSEWYEEYLRASISIVVGSGSEWKQKYIKKFFREQIHLDQSKWRLCIPFADKQVLADIRKILPKRKVYGIPFHPDPYEENDEVDHQIEELLKLNQHHKLNVLKKRLQAIFN
ncbi:putative CoA-binding protein [Paenibacillus sp. LBL]|uniref:hypothetical protein n=1 Tax=Paenibacillus sp. LBL TaxID=2940563 RepID=UPI002476C9A8|nr:hypothetical protein [Paenibacillus sp. LBL]MDH6675742.1 putative CoA-binding protein [Paenibacillus sp. LBL]